MVVFHSLADLNVRIKGPRDPNRSRAIKLIIVNIIVNGATSCCKVASKHKNVPPYEWKKTKI